MKRIITPAQAPILDCIVRGFSNERIAAELGISVKTVDSHITHIRERTGINNRVLLALWWRDNAGITG